MDQAYKREPFLVLLWIGSSESFCGLEKMLDLRELSVRVAIVTDLVEQLNGLPDGRFLLAGVGVGVFFMHGGDKVEGLFGVVEVIGLGD